MNQDTIVAQFLTAVRDHHFALAKSLLDEHPTLTRDNIHAAAAVGDASVVRMLLHANRSLATDSAPPVDVPPVMYAVSSDLKRLLGVSDEAHVDTVRALLDAGADPNTRVSLPDVSDGIPILYFPCVSNTVGVARLLLERGAKPDDGESLYHAAEHDHRECLELLLEFGADLSGTNPTTGNTPLHFLAAHTVSNELAPAVQRGMAWLLEHGADPNVRSHRSASGAVLPGGSETPLIRAAASGFDEAVMRLFIDHGAVVDAARDDGKAAYTMAIRAGNSSAAVCLARAGADVSRLSPVDQLLGACALADETVARAILADHPDVITQATPEDRQALGRAVSDNRADVVRTMVAIGWPLDDEGEWGGTPLHWAAWNARVSMVSLLLQHGAPVNVRDTRYGSSPIAWAAHGSRWSGHGTDDEYVAITTMLLDAGATRAESFNFWNEALESFARPAVLRVLTARGFVPPP